MSLFGERMPIPRVVEYAVPGKPGETIVFDESSAQPVNVETRQGVIRHVEVTAYMSSRDDQKSGSMTGWASKLRRLTLNLAYENEPKL